MKKMENKKKDKDKEKKKKKKKNSVRKMMNNWNSNKPKKNLRKTS